MELKSAKSNKTEAVMRLLTGKKVAANPSLNSSHKEESEALQNIEQPKAAEQPKVEPKVIEQPKVEPQVTEQPKVIEQSKPSTVEIDVTGELITELMPQVLDRFHCCKCPICYADAVAEAGNRVPMIKVKVNNKDDMKLVDKMKDQHRKDVMMTLVRLAVERKMLPKHE